ncbi:hypothetical protein NHX12_021306 [Muraenolepis orangiensis]|uniref:Uncharacterized protein n=1 Tax=Muraenolepis orangiensis TaxID=630683 RepID=A0A9Q0IUZ3_9TELE|nr:hypothetical protein NHX12_021306 [Muraenolepis orangiensis]
MGYGSTFCSFMGWKKNNHESPAEATHSEECTGFHDTRARAVPRYAACGCNGSALTARGGRGRRRVETPARDRQGLGPLQDRYSTVTRPLPDRYRPKSPGLFSDSKRLLAFKVSSMALVMEPVSKWTTSQVVDWMKALKAKVAIKQTAKHPIKPGEAAEAASHPPAARGSLPSTCLPRPPPIHLPPEAASHPPAARGSLPSTCRPRQPPIHLPPEAASHPPAVGQRTYGVYISKDVAPRRATQIGARC